jgi:hypothetical protein
MNNKLERIWKETVAVQFKMQSWHLLGGTEENYENASKDSRLRAEI